MAKNYKLTYFSGMGLAEPIRFLLIYSGKEFEENLLSREDWPKIKPTTPYGKVPVLEIDGKTLHQTKAICRYLGRQVNLCGSSDWENLQVDAVPDTLDDLRVLVYLYLFEKNEEAKKAKYETLQKETLPFYLSRFEAQAQANGGYMANGKLSWADFYFATEMKAIWSKGGPEADLSKYPTLKALIDKIYTIPQIAEYLKNRAPYAY